MIDVQVYDPASDEEPFRAFVAGMLNDWLDQSSMQRDVECCPERTIAAVLEQFERASRAGDRLLVARDSAAGQIVGCVVLEWGPRWLRAGEAFLLNVHPAYRSTGCARRLLGTAVVELRKKRFKKLRLATWEGNDPALRLFEACGAQVVARDPGRTATTETFLPLVLSTVGDERVDRAVRAGEFLARASAEGVLVDMELCVEGALLGRFHTVRS